MIPNIDHDDDWMWRFCSLTPKDIASQLRLKGIVGQDEAVATASLILYNHIFKRRSVNLFIAPSGSGKTFIWNMLQENFGANRILILDSSMLTIEGYKGNLKISSIFENLPPEQRSRIILVLDEFDKSIEPQYGASGTNYADMLQNQFLRLFNGDTMLFKGEKVEYSVDGSGISIVLLGAFEKLMMKKRESASKRTIGFGSQPQQTCTDDNINITVEDLINAGMRREIAGRITRIVQMEPLSIENLTNIGFLEVEKLSQKFQRPIEVDRSIIVDLAHKAAEMKLGARYISSVLNNALDYYVYEDPYADSYTIDFSALYDNKLGQEEIYIEK